MLKFYRNGDFGKNVRNVVSFRFTKIPWTIQYYKDVCKICLPSGYLDLGNISVKCSFECHYIQTNY